MAKARVGYALGYGKFTNVKEMADVMKQAEERGFEMAFFSETIELMRDSVTSLAAIGLAVCMARRRGLAKTASIAWPARAPAMAWACSKPAGDSATSD